LEHVAAPTRCEVREREEIRFEPVARFAERSETLGEVFAARVRFAARSGLPEVADRILRGFHPGPPARSVVHPSDRVVWWLQRTNPCDSVAPSPRRERPIAMKQIVQNPGSGTLELVEVPIPALASGQVLVRNQFSVVSPGTEKMAIDFARKSLLGKAR